MNTNNPYANITDLGGPRCCERLPVVECGSGGLPRNLVGDTWRLIVATGEWEKVEVDENGQETGLH